MKAKVFLTSCIFFFCVIFLSTCDYFATINQVIGGLSGSIVANNRAASRSSVSMDADEKIEFWINRLNYVGQADGGKNSRGENTYHHLNMIMHGGTDGVSNPNDGWHGVDKPFPISTSAYGAYYVIDIIIHRMRIGGEEYPFPVGGVYFGKNIHNISFLEDPNIFSTGYPDRFGGIDFNRSVGHVRTVIRVDPEIMDCWNENRQLVQGKNPYDYIYIEGQALSRGR